MAFITENKVDIAVVTIPDKAKFSIIIDQFSFFFENFT